MVSNLLFSFFIPMLAFIDFSIGVPPASERVQVFVQENIVSVKGSVKQVVRIHDLRARMFRVHLFIESDGEEFDVHVGPSWFLEDIDLQFKEGEEVEVEGPLFEFDGGRALIAMRIKVGDKEFVLRDERGFPVWRGRGGYWR